MKTWESDEQHQATRVQQLFTGFYRIKPILSVHLCQKDNRKGTLLAPRPFGSPALPHENAIRNGLGVTGDDVTHIKRLRLTCSPVADWLDIAVNHSVLLGPSSTRDSLLHTCICVLIWRWGLGTQLREWWEDDDVVHQGAFESIIHRFH